MNPRYQAAVIVLVLVTGIGLRLAATSAGFTYDIRSYRDVADIMAAGGTVYDQTDQYNYGPVWAHVLQVVDKIGPDAADRRVSLHWKVAVFLTLVDLGIFAFLLRRYSTAVAALFFLSPLSIIITGYHSQFDNLAVLLGLLAVDGYARSPDSVRRSAWLGMLGLSLSVKHVLFLFPVWLALKEELPSRRILVLALPYAVFGAGFLPYLPESSVAIVENVFRYRSSNDAPLWSLLFTDAVKETQLQIVLFFVALLVVGVAVRRRAALESLHVYLIALVTFTSAMANQYLAICTAPVAVLWNWAFGLYTAVGTVFLLVHEQGLRLSGLQAALGWKGEGGYKILVGLLAVGLLVTWNRVRKTATTKSRAAP